MRISDWSSDVCSSDLQSSVDGHVHVVEVVGGRGPSVLHGAPPLAAAVDRPDLLGVDRIFDAERAGVGPDVFRDLPSRVPADHDVDRAALRVLAVVSERAVGGDRSEEHTSELQSLMRISYAVFCLKKQKKTQLAARLQKALHY